MTVVDQARAAGASARRATAEGVDVMAALLESEGKAGHDPRRARWTAAAGALVAAAVVAVVVWISLGGDDAADNTPVTPQPTEPIGAELEDLAAPFEVPAGWTVEYDGPLAAGVQSPDESASFFVIRPDYVVDPGGSGLLTYGQYLTFIREHPWFRVVDEQPTTVDGRPAVRLVVEAERPASEGGGNFGIHYFDESARFTASYEIGDQATLTVIDVDGRELVVEGFGVRQDSAPTLIERYDEFVAALDIR